MNMLKRLDFNLLGTSSSSSSSSSLRQQHDHPAHAIVSEDVQSILKQLNWEELEIAARASHEYNVNVDDNDVNDDKTTGKNSIKQRDYYASKMIQRYLVIHQNNIPKALKHIKDTIEFRKTIDIDHLLNAPTNRSSEHYIPLRTFFSTKKLYVQGYDKDGRSTYYFIPRYIQQEQQEQQHRQQNQLKQSKQNHQYHHQNQNQQHHNNNYMSLHSKYTIRGHVWTIERAIACSKSIDKTINAVVDFSGFIPTKHSPSFSVGKDLMTTLSNYYIHHINNIYLVDVPFTFLCLWNVYKKFACKQTRSKIHFVQSVDPTTTRHQQRQQKRQHDKKHLGNQHPFFVHRSNSIDRTEGSVVRHNNSTTATTTATSGSTNNNRILYDFYEKDQLPSWMIPGGTKNRELDVIEYLDAIPFHHAFDE